MARLFLFLALIFGNFFSSDVLPVYDPPAIYLTWRSDPTTTMMIQWLSSLNETGDVVQYRKAVRDDWHEVTATHSQLPHSSPYLLHRLELTGLTPQTDYYFRIGKNGVPYKFRTLPTNLGEPLKMVVGGDIYHDAIELVRKTNQMAASKSPHFALLGGDIAYAANKELGNNERWITWLNTWKQTMITPEGYLIPILLTLGNHDTQGKYHQNPSQAQFYYSLFVPAPLRGYRSFDAGDYLSIVLLDSGHTHPVSGAQKEWLEQTLEKRKEVLHRFALYHVPAYPSVRSLDAKISPDIRRHWVPLFEKYKLHAAFENHDHGYKRTFPLKNGKKDASGVLYLGDGAWGVDNPRLAKSRSQAKYLAKTAPKRHFILVTLENSKRTFEAIDDLGERIDIYETNDL